MEPRENDIILDCTFGLGSEAILISHFLKNGKVIGLEASEHVYNVVKWGLGTYKAKQKWIDEAMKRIELIHDDYKKFIRSTQDMYDCVYCDPMFENPNFKSDSLNPLRPFAIYDSLNQDDIDVMCRIARRKVVIKARDSDSLLRRIKVDKICGSRRSGVLYGIINCEGDRHG